MQSKEETALIRAYQSLAIYCLEEGRNLKDILQIPEYAQISLTEEEIIDYGNELDEAEEMYSILNEQQKLIIDNILAKLQIPLPTASNNGNLTNCEIFNQINI
jgi:hypothetical protein